MVSYDPKTISLSPLDSNFHKLSSILIENRAGLVRYALEGLRADGELEQYVVRWHLAAHVFASIVDPPVDLGSPRLSDPKVNLFGCRPGNYRDMIAVEP